MKKEELKAKYEFLKQLLDEIAKVIEIRRKEGCGYDGTAKIIEQMVKMKDL